MECDGVASFRHSASVNSVLLFDTNVIFFITNIGIIV